jgi:hypothetical protein
MEFSSNWLDFIVVGAYLGITIIVTVGVFMSGKKR